jgi:hypothetical protein
VAVVVDLLGQDHLDPRVLQVLQVLLVQLVQLVQWVRWDH